MPTPNTADAMKRYRAGKAGFTDKAHLKAKGLIPRADGTKRKSDKYKEDMDRQPQDKDVKKKPGTQPKKYYKTLTKKQKDKRADFFKKQKYRKSDDDDDYKPAPGDAGAKTKKSIHTKKFQKMYGEDAPANATGTAVAGTGDDSSTVVMKKKKDKETMKDRLLRRFKIKETIDRTIPDLEKPKDEIKEKAKMMKAMAMKSEENLDETIKAVKNKAEKTGMPYSILKQVYNRGMAAWKGGHRPGATQQQWALARVNSFVTKSSGTWGGADKDLAKKVRAAKK
jgi:predicted DNA binding CopG/RHH family protein